MYYLHEECTIGLAFDSLLGLTNLNLRGIISLLFTLSMSLCFECKCMFLCNACSDCATTHEVEVMSVDTEKEFVNYTKLTLQLMHNFIQLLIISGRYNLYTIL